MLTSHVGDFVNFRTRYFYSLFIRATDKSNRRQGFCGKRSDLFRRANQKARNEFTGDENMFDVTRTFPV